jgi:hypothetical protein
MSFLFIELKTGGKQDSVSNRRNSLPIQLASISYCLLMLQLVRLRSGLLRNVVQELDPGSLTVQLCILHRSATSLNFMSLLTVSVAISGPPLCYPGILLSLPQQKSYTLYSVVFLLNSSLSNLP